MAQSKRSVKIAFPGGTAPKEVQSDATTWGELKTQLKDELNESFTNQKVRDYTTNHHYSDAEAILPTGDLKLLVSTDKNKSGMSINKANYHKAGFSDLRTFCKKMTGFAPNGKQACIDALDKHYGKTSPVSTVKSTTKKVAVKAPISKAKAKEIVAETTKASTKAKKSYSLEDRVSILEQRFNHVFGSNDEDADFLKAARNLK